MHMTLHCSNQTIHCDHFSNHREASPVTTMEQRMERIEDMMLYQLELLAGLQSEITQIAALDGNLS